MGRKEEDGMRIQRGTGRIGQFFVQFFMVAPNYLGHFITFFPLGPIFFFTHMYLPKNKHWKKWERKRGERWEKGEEGQPTNQSTE
jgi:hypothetical protein